ncbi:MAG: hypothetical protein LBQ30_02505 [Treponema sp.]|jgi:hypothetical protein|nr:hypothetical protein [Treponema sp.]
MIQVLFFLRFRTQLRRTRPQLTFQLEEAVSAAFTGSGGKVEHKQRIIVGSFDEQALGIWLNIITLLEEILALLEQAASELYGYSLVIGENFEDYAIGRLCSILAARSGGTRIWCAPSVTLPLSPYVEFAKTLREPGEFPAERTLVQDEGAILIPADRSSDPALIEGYVQVNHLETPSKQDPLPDRDRIRDIFPLRDKILQIIKYGAAKNVVLLGPAFMGKRAGLYRFCAETLGEIPPLILRFTPRRSLGCLADMLSPPIRALMAGYMQAELLEELDALGTVLFRERLIDEYSNALLQKGGLFLKQVLVAYTAAVQHRKGIPVFILEDLHNADATLAQLVITVCKALQDNPALHCYGTYSYELAPPSPSLDAAAAPHRKEPTKGEKSESTLRLWEEVFPKTLRFPPEYYPARTPPEMPLDLWEVAYAAHLLQPYFPGSLFPQLFDEEESTAAMALRAFTMLFKLGVIDSIEDPVPRLYNFRSLAEAMLGERTERIRGFVRNRLLAWVLRGALRPCFGLLEILTALGGYGEDALVLNAIYGDIINGTYQGIEQAIQENRFDAVVGTDKGPVLFYIFITFKALMHGDEAEIQEAFMKPVPLDLGFTGYKIHILVNLTCYYLGTKKLDTALAIVKEAMLIGQKQRQGITRVYRLFALVNLIRQQVDDAIDYISFAVENAERLEQFDALAVSAYYAAIVQFLFGNLSWAEQFAQQAEQAALRSGQADWVDRIRFFRGKLRFEIGYYQDALDIFKTLQEHPVGSVSENSERILAAWMYRTRVYLGGDQKPNSPVQLTDLTEAALEVPSAAGEAFLFEVEASYITGDYQRTIYLTEKIHLQDPDITFLYTERPDWRSGFAQCELLLVEPHDLWERMLLTYRGLALCRLPAPGSDREQVIGHIQKFLRNDLLPDRNPGDIFYFYAYYRMLQESGAAEIDLNTAVSMAFKRLQHRANRIDDLETRRVFLNLHYWNGALSSAAKEHKLI